MSRTETNAREINKYLSSLAYPCSREELAAHARQNGADENVVRAIRELPYDYFTSPYEVREAMDE